MKSFFHYSVENTDMTSMKFLFGIEHEVAFLHAGGAFADFSNTTFRDFQRLIDQLPSYGEDLKKLRQGDLGIKAKRWYIEGFERFHEDKTFWQCLPKGIEIRTAGLASIFARAARHSPLEPPCRAALAGMSQFFGGLKL